MNYINEVDDSLRRFVTTEPRAHTAMCVNLVLPPVREDADVAFIVFDAARAHPMSGSNCICVVTALLETGRVQMSEPETIVRLDTAAGLVVARAKCADGRSISVSHDDGPAFAVDQARPILTEKWGTIRADIAFGGLFCVLVDVAQIGLTLDTNNARALAEAGFELHVLIAEHVQVSHPDIPGLNNIAFVMFRDNATDGAVLTCTTLRPGRVDALPAEREVRPILPRFTREIRFLLENSGFPDPLQAVSLSLRPGKKGLSATTKLSFHGYRAGPLSTEARHCA